jgi:DNA mismatch repair protein MutS
MTQTDRRGVHAEQVPAPARSSARAKFGSILFDDVQEARTERPAFFIDLNLDQVVDGIVGGRDDYNLTPFFHTPVERGDTVGYRHEVFRDLEKDALRAAVDEFAAAMRRVRSYLALVEKQPYVHETQRWFVDAAATYCGLVRRFADAVAGIEVESRGLRRFRGYLAGYCSSPVFASLESEAHEVIDGLQAVRYTVRIKAGRVTVQAYAGESDYTVEVERTFARFREGAAEDHLVKVPDSGSMDHVEARIAELVSRLFPAQFQALEVFFRAHGDFVDPVIARFDREVQFYLAYADYIQPLTAAGLAFSYPVLVDGWGETAVEGGFDLALAGKAGSAAGAIVPNDFALRGAERILVVTGPNQGGKTTFARMVGQLHYLAALGVPVTAGSARLALADQLFTLFGKREDITTLHGRLDEELVQVRAILQQATSRSLILLNEVLSSTTLEDAVYLGNEVLGRVADRGCATVWVTFVDELADTGAATVSMMAGVHPDDPSQRTYKIARKPADGRAYASALAEKYGLSYPRLRHRISP